MPAHWLAGFDYMGGFQVRLAKCLCCPPEHKSISRVPFVPPLHPPLWPPPPPPQKGTSQLHPFTGTWRARACCVVPRRRFPSGTVPVIFHACHSLVPLLVSPGPSSSQPKEDTDSSTHTLLYLSVLVLLFFFFSLPSHRFPPFIKLSPFPSFFI